MKRFQEKVKDIIEVRQYKSLLDFISEPAQTLAIYRFTDFTSDLMTKYIDKVAAITGGSGTAAALAGYRGVGKSHLLAAFGALLAHPELRSKIEDARVAASLQSLKRTRFAVAYVRRGTRATLFAELKEAVAKTFETNAESLPDSLSELLDFAARRAGGLPFVIIVDTAFERVSRVARDDGALLGGIAEKAKELNMFCLVALDDDIADADGINAAIARNFTIDYLDQEHLYRIVDTHLFPKNRQMLPTLHEIYTNFREALPGFRWSEGRFTALYPLHPIILELAPFVRLYAPEFVLLGFAAEAGARILARPANSLIALDEVFDALENSLRKAPDLEDAFAAYDFINKNYIPQISIMQRLQAKLVLKALFLLSLDGDGTTASEIAASMLLYDDGEPGSSIRSVEHFLDNFAMTFEAGIKRTSKPEKAIRYNLVVGKTNAVGAALNEAVKTIPPSIIPKILRRAARDRFADWVLPDASAQPNDADALDCTVVWRGSLRRGRIVWNLTNKPETSGAPESGEMLDWELIINPQGNPAAENSSETSKIFWRPAALKKDEADTILRYCALLSDQNLRREYGEQLRAAGQSHALSVEKIWNRIFLEDATVSAAGFTYQIPEHGRNAATLNDGIACLLEPFFEKMYPDHPYFAETLEANAVSALVGDFFGGTRQNFGETQHLAETFALPLGLVALNGSAYTVETEEHLANLRLTAQILALLEESPDETVTLKQIHRTLKKQPYGLVGEAQHLILTALVAQRQIEFVTAHGDRINRRSLDLKIIWDDIEGVAKPSSVVYSDERLTEWARLLTGSVEFESINHPADREIVFRALDDWLADWKTNGILNRFEKLPDEILNTKIWRLAAGVGKTFGSVAATLGAVAAKSVALEEGLHRVADEFNNSETDFSEASKNLVVLENFIKGVAVREEIRKYLTVCENTDEPEIESLREKLFDLIERSYANPDQEINREMENAWTNFRDAFAKLFAAEHDAVMKAQEWREESDEFIKSDEWWEFETLSRFDIFEKTYWSEAQTIRRRLSALTCRFDVGEMLEIHPFCACSFDLTKAREHEKLPAALRDAVGRGRLYYSKILRSRQPALESLIARFSQIHEAAGLRESVAKLSEFLRTDGESKILSNDELIVLQEILNSLPAESTNASSGAMF